MQGRGSKRFFFGFLCWIAVFSMLMWSPAACRPSGPNPGDDKKAGEDKGKEPTDARDPGDDRTPPPDERQGTKDEKDPPKELTINDIQDPNSSKKVNKGDAVALKGVVVVSALFVVSNNTGQQAFFAAGATFPPAKYGGILVVVDKEFDTKLAIGDKVDIEGVADEFFFNTQINAGASKGGNVTKTGTIPAADVKPLVVKPEEIPGAPADKTAPDASPAEPYEGVFVELKDVEVMEAADNFGVWKLKGGVVVDDTFFRGYKPKVGDKIPFVRGLLYYSFDLYRLLPRSAADISGAKPQCDANTPCGTGRKCDNGNCVTIKCTKDEECNTGETCNTTTQFCQLPQKTVTIEDVQNPKSPNYVPANNPVELKGVIAASELFEVSANLNGFFVASPKEPAPTQWGGVMVVISKTWTETLAIGDVLDIVGRTSEFYNNTQVSIDLSKDGKITKTGANKADKIKPLAVSAANFEIKPADSSKPDDSKTEALEGMLVELKDVTVEEEPDKNGEWKVTGGFIIDDAIFKATVAKGEKYTSIIGFVQFNFGSYRIIPRSAADLKK